MAWNDGVDRATGYIVSSPPWNDLLGSGGSLMHVKNHVHGGVTGHGSQSIGPLVLTDLTDAAAPAAPGAGQTRNFSTGGRPHFRAGASGADFEYLTADMFDAKGDLITATAADAWVRKAVGADDTILMADSAQADGLKWVAPATPVAIGTANDPGTSDDFTRGDHVHAHEAAHIQHDTTWAAKGDLIAGTANDTAGLRVIAANDNVLMASSASGTGLKYGPTPGSIVLVGEISTASGTSAFFSIPSGVKRITIMFVGVSYTDPTFNASIRVQLNLSGSGYVATSQKVSASVSTTNPNTDSFYVTGICAPGAILHGTATLTLESGTTWTCISMIGDTTLPEMHFSSGSKTIGSAISSVYIDFQSLAFDAGAINVAYEAPP